MNELYISPQMLSVLIHLVQNNEPTRTLYKHFCPETVQLLIEENMLEIQEKGFCITAKGIQVLKELSEYMIEVEIPNQPSLFVRDMEELKDAFDDDLNETFELLKMGDFDGVLFTLKAKQMTLYEYATLPAWEPI